MRSALERKLDRTWYGGRSPGVLLSALEHFYKALAALHRRYLNLRRDRELEGRPIIVVGNLTAGGTGKTPFVIGLCKLARSCGLKPGVISRGYGRSSRQPLRVNANTDPADCGDEPYLIARRCQVPVQVDVRRERAAHELFREKVDVVISDDGLQRASLPRQTEICLVDQSRGMGNGRLLPAGPLREPVTRLDTVDFVVENLSGDDRPLLTQGFSMKLRPGALRSLHGGKSMPLAEAGTAGAAVHAVAGIACPEKFFSMLEKAGIHAVPHPFPDHHRFQKHDFDPIPADAIIIMTEKDAVKCRKLPLFNAWYAPVEAVFSQELEKALVKLLESSENTGTG